MPTKFERERDEQRLARHLRVAQQIKDTDKQMSRETSRTLLLYTGDIVPDPDQPRRLYEEDTAALQELAASIRALGVLSPIQVRPDPNAGGQYVIIVGERRWRACQIAGVNRIEAVVRDDWDFFQIRAAQYEENEKRQDVSDVARARSLMAMRHVDGGSRRRGWEEVAERVGLQRNQAMRLVGLLQLPDPVVELIDRRLLPGTHGTELVRLLGRVPEDEVVAIARSCTAPVPGGKARCPVKELSRTITDRLQAAHEAARLAHTNQDSEQPNGPENGPEHVSHGPDNVDMAVSGGMVGPLAERKGDQQDLAEDEGRAALSQSLLSIPGNASIANFPDTDRPHTPTSSSGADEPRPFVLQLVETWESGELTVRERELLWEAWKKHPLDPERLEARPT